MDEHQLVDRVYDTLLEVPDALPQLLADIADYAGVHTVGLSLISSTERWGISTVPRVDPHLVASHLDKWAKKDPAFDLLLTYPIRKIGGLGVEQLERFKRSPAYQESWRNSGMGAQRRFSILHNDRALTTVFTMHAGERHDEIGPDGELIYEHLLPHVSRAARILHKQRQFHLEYMSSMLRCPRDIVGVFYTDPAGVLIYADRGGEEMLRLNDSFHLKGRCYLALQNQSADKELAKAIQECGNVASASSCHPVAIRSSLDRRLLSIDVLPFTRGARHHRVDPWIGEKCKAVIVVRDPERHRQHVVQFLRETFDLTYSEAILAVEVLKGGGREDAAARCGITLNTARAHLRSIYLKMNISRQTELIAIVRDQYQL